LTSILIYTHGIEKNFRIKKTKHIVGSNQNYSLQPRYTMQSYIGMLAEYGVKVYETMGAGTVWVEEGSGRNIVRMIGYGKV